MLEAHEFTVGSLSQAQRGSLILPRSERDEAFLVGTVEHHAVAVFLSGSDVYQCFGSQDNTSWKGLIVPDVRVQVDPESVFDPSRQSAPIGALIRYGTFLTIRSSIVHSFGQETRVSIVDGLPDTGSHQAGFTDWQIVLGTGTEKRVLWTSGDYVGPDEV
jgi:hypothetical protein